MKIKICFFLCRIIVTGRVLFSDFSVVINLLKMIYGKMIPVRKLIKSDVV